MPDGGGFQETHAKTTLINPHKETMKAAALIQCKASKMPYKTAVKYLEKYDIILNSERTYQRWMKNVSDLTEKRRAALMQYSYRETAYNAVIELELVKANLQEIMLTSRSDIARVNAAHEYRDVIIMHAMLQDELARIEVGQIVAREAFDRERQNKNSNLLTVITSPA